MDPMDQQDHPPFYAEDDDLFFAVGQDPARYVFELRCQGRVTPLAQSLPRAQRHKPSAAAYIAPVPG
ncbi:MAG TPA: hypothetical protein VFT75_18630 [Nocardioidaceae bacterium]|nr:hypothetical protein [Nocardioidaceae bacterium]